MSDLQCEEEPTRALRPVPERVTERTIRISGEHAVGPRRGDTSRTVILKEPPSSLAWLVIRSGARAGSIFTLDPRGTSIGRDVQCDIVLDDESVSRQHAKVKAKKATKNQERYYVWDLASANGTFVNGKQVTKQLLQDGDEVKIGTIPLVFKQV